MISRSSIRVARSQNRNVGPVPRYAGFVAVRDRSGQGESLVGESSGWGLVAMVGRKARTQAAVEAKVFSSLLVDQVVEILPPLQSYVWNLCDSFLFLASAQEQTRLSVEYRNRSALLESRQRICP